MDRRQQGPAAALFTAGNSAPFMAFAGLWERWIDPETLQEMLSATIIVGAASKWMRKYHDRMPIILDRRISMRGITDRPALRC